MAEDAATAALRNARLATRSELANWRRRLWAHAELTPGDKLFGNILVDEFFNIDTGQTNPSLGKMADMTGEGIRAAKKHADAVRSANMLGWKSGSGRSSSWYSLLDEHGTSIPGSLERLGITKVTRRGTDVPSKRTLPGTSGPVSLEQDGGLCGTSVPPNLKNHELNLSAELQQLRQEVGVKRWRPHVFAGAAIEPPRTILFRSPRHLEFALKHYQADFDQFGYQVAVRSAA